jgi:hypothetical protein
MGDTDYENDYLARKKRLRDLHKRLKETKDVQEIYHKIMGSAEGTQTTAESSTDEA